MANHTDAKARRAAGRRPKRKPRNLETTVSEIAQRPAPIRRSIFDLMDTLISSREQRDPAPGDESDSQDAARGPDEAQPPSPDRRSGSARGSRESR